jgi:hypothetical protein
MIKRTVVCTAIAASLLVAACSSSQRVLMPPRVDLYAWGTIGMLDFTASPPDELGVLAAREFLAAVQAAQPGVPVLELGSQRTALAAVKQTALTPEAIRALGKQHHIDTLLVGFVESKSLQPSFSLRHAAERLSGGAAADLEASLRVRMYDAHTGATVWSATSGAREEIANVYVAGDDYASVRASDPAQAETRLVRRLVRYATGDFWPYWVRQ